MLISPSKKIWFYLLFGYFFVGSALDAQNKNNDENFPLSKESLGRVAGISPGETLTFDWNDSKIFPGTTRKIRVYVPNAYTAEKPACVAIFQDGGGYRFETVFDNLIYSGEMPVTIGVVVPPGDVPGVVDSNGVRHNRTFEYDSPGDRYARFLLEEILPHVETLSTSDGRPIRLSKNGNDRMIAGGSSGAAAAFNAAWAMPEEFSRVFSAIGSYTGLRGSYIYPTLIHKVEPKPLRLFLQSGTRDMWTSFGDWWSANNAMVRALQFANYDYAYEFGDGRHSGAHGTALFPKAMRFLWKGWPDSIKAGVRTRNHAIQSTVYPDRRWKETTTRTFEGARNLCTDAKGQVYFSRKGLIYKISGAGIVERVGTGTLWSFYNDGESMIVETSPGKLELIAPNGNRAALAQGIFPASIAVARSGDVYVEGAVTSDTMPDKIWRLRPNAEPLLVAEGLPGIGALSLSGDGNWLAAFERNTTRGYSYRVEKDGTLKYGQTFYVLHKLDEKDGADAVWAAADGSAYGYQFIATGMGVQICDANGRSAAILPLPKNAAAVSLCFGGKDFKTLYVLACDGRIYERPTKQPGAQPFLPGITITTKAG